MPDKTHRLKEIDVPKLYFRDFLRGFLDGDGSIFRYTDNYMVYKNRRYAYQRLYTTFYSASRKNLLWIQNNLNQELNIRGALNSWQKEKRYLPFWSLRFAKNDSLKLLRWIYYKPDLPCLIRKKRIAELALAKFSQ